MAIAYLQEFQIKDGDTSTTNYDAVVEALNLTDTPEGLLIHTAGFDHDGGSSASSTSGRTRSRASVSWASNSARSSSDLAARLRHAVTTSTPPDRESWYELHHVMP